MFRIFMYDTMGVKHTVYDPSSDDETLLVTSAKVTNEIDKAGEASFTIAKIHPLYNMFRKISTLVEIRRDNAIIFFGRVYGIRRDFYMNKTITCEGALAFLEDICLMPFHYLKLQRDPASGAEYYTYENKSKWDYFKDIMAVYNKYCQEDRKLAYYSNVIDETFAYNEIDGTTSFNSVLKEIQDKIIGDFDYSLMCTYYQDEETGKPAAQVNICRQPIGSSNQKIEFGKNLIDFEEYIDASECYNCIIPVGKGNICIFSDDGESENSTVPIIDRIWWVQGGLDSDINGIIHKVVNFDNIETVEELWEAAQAMFSYGGGVTSYEFEINAIDLNLLDVNVNAIDIGKSVRVISEPHNIDDEFVCYKADINLLEPDQSSYTFKKPTRMSPETMTDHLYTTLAGINERMNKKLNADQAYGAVTLSTQGSYLNFAMEDDTNGS